jgi:hypothetical protein
MRGIRVRPATSRLVTTLLVIGLASVSSPEVAAQLPTGSLIVTITSPTSGSTVGGTVPVTATVTIVGGLVVRGVQFRLDGANLGAEDTAAPYSIPWDTRTASNGSHTLIAIARDLLGVSYSSNPLTVTVFNDTTPPVVTVTSPASGAALAGTTTINATATDNIGVVGVQFRVDGANVGPEDATAPYSVPWNTASATAGPHTVTAVARDAAGNVTTSAGVAVTVDNVAPTIAMASPSAGSTVAGTVSVNANASDNLGIAAVQFKLDGANLGAEDTSAPYSAPWNTTAASAGSHSLAAVARDTAGNVTTSATVVVTVDHTPPTVALTAPQNGATVNGTLAVTATASDSGGIAGIQFKLDGANLGAEDTAAPYSTSWNTSAASSGSHSLTAVARDPAGNITTSAAVVVTVDNSGPTVALTAPQNGATVNGTVTVTATASDSGSIAGVQFKLDGANLGAEDTTAPYAVDWNTTTATSGSHTLTAVARDGTGNTATAPTVTVTVSNATETVVRVEDSSPSITYAGSWALGNTAKPWSGGTAALATSGPSATGDPTRATLTFNGTAVRWIGFQGPQTGIAKVFLDGSLVTTVDTYAAAEVVGAVLYTVSGLASASHTLAIESTGTRNPASSDIFVVVDAFDVTTTSGGADTTPPSVALTAPGAGASVSGTIAVAANASDAGGVAGVQFKLDGANLGAEDTTTPFSINWDTTSVGDGSHTLTAVARDAAGNSSTSSAVVVSVSNSAPPPASVTTRFENTHPAIVYTPGSAATGVPNWWHGSRSRGWSAETASFNRSEGARATFTFTGTSVTWIGFRANWAGIGKVYVDGAFAGEIDLYSPTEQAQSRIFTASGLAQGTHTFAVESTDRKNANATDNAVVVDAFDVGPAVPPTTLGTRIEDTSAALTFGAGWAPASMGGAWSGGTAAASATTGARATLTFTGTTVTMLGFRGPATGIVRVYLDGALHSTVDTYSPTEIQAPIFTDTNLMPGSHEMIVEVSGLKNAASSGVAIVVDAFDVRTRFEEPDPAIAYAGTWIHDMNDAFSGTSANYGSGGARRSAVAGARATFSFKGTSVTWVGFRGQDAGIARVYLDGAFVTDVDTYASPKQVQAALFTASGLSGGQHTLAIEVTGQKNAASTNTFIRVDAFDLTLPAPAPVVQRFQQTDATYPTGVWQTSTANMLYTGGTMANSNTAGSAAVFTFNGSSIRWVGQRVRDGGIARITLDGVVVADIDTWAGVPDPDNVQEEFQAAMFTASGLTPGSHTLRIEVLGTKNHSSEGTRIVVDAFDVIQ